ncbi:MAG: class I SAM-dependent methyltransferase [Gammaproteobacteria bacterium]|nr:class I SAM-dependent methyltransferase [Gammaproteobacteria bacterium]
MKTTTITLDLGQYQNEGHLRHKIFRSLLSSEIDVSGKWVADLGAGPCRFARVANEFGAEVFAVDGRAERVPGNIEKQGIHFFHSDMREFNLAAFDVVLIFGLLYHLDIDDQVELLRRCQGKEVLVDTQVCCPNLAVRFPLDEWQYTLVQANGYEGIVFSEQDNPMASIVNNTSFWHTEPSYFKLFSDCGFNEITAYRPLYLSKYGMRSFYRLLPG